MFDATLVMNKMKLIKCTFEEFSDWLVAYRKGNLIASKESWAKFYYIF